jgi:hypothetical protein
MPPGTYTGITDATPRKHNAMKTASTYLTPKTMKQLITFFSFFVFTFFISTGSAWAQPGANDPTFNTFDDGTYGIGADGQIRTTALQPDGKVIIGGGFGSYNGTPRNRYIPTSSIAATA